MKKLTRNQKETLIAIYTLIQGKHGISPSISEIAEKMNKSLMAVQKTLNILEEKKVIGCLRNPQTGRRKNRTIFIKNRELLQL